MRLENRVVPGETMGASMPWATGLLALGSFAAGEMGGSRIESAVGSTSAWRTSDWSDDSSSISITSSSDEYWASQAVRNFGAQRSDALGQSQVVTADIDLGDAFVSAAPTASQGASNTAPGSTSIAAAPIAGLAGNPYAATDLMAESESAQMTAWADATNAPMLVARHTSAPNGVHHDAGLVYDPAQIRHAYGFDQVSNQGAGQTIYIVDAYNDPNITNDLHTFDAQWGLSNPTFTVHKMSSRIRNSTSWGVEESLDVEWAHAIAPQAAITLVEATSATNSALYSAVDWATNNGAHVVSMSWGGGDSSGESSGDSHFNHNGVSYVASSGDTGGAVLYPSASPYVLSVGGTNLPLDSNGNRTGAETAWTSGGGGASLYESEPTYQRNYGISLSGRGTPDVSYDADPNTGFYVYDSYLFQPGWYQVGGTSAGAPQWAALIALVNQSRSTPLSTNNLTSRTEYNAATGSVYSSNYTDITSGSNGYNAGPGYDLATGVGTPLANNLVGWMINNS
jgi:subtilase family serine protease